MPIFCVSDLHFFERYFSIFTKKLTVTNDMVDLAEETLNLSQT